MQIDVITAELAAWAKGYSGPKFHAVLCDPPYGLSFMGKKWDEQLQAKEWATALLPLLYPGAIVMAFGGTRMWHRLACGFEDAGFQMWDTLMWLYGQGFPKAQDISKLIDSKNGHEREVLGVRKYADGTDGHWGLSDKYAQDSHTKSLVAGTPKLDTGPGSPQSAPWSGHKTCALKPAWEPILCFRAPDGGKTYAELALQYGSGALNVDGGRIPAEPGLAKNWGRHQSIAAEEGRNAMNGGLKTIDLRGYTPTGRYPANLCLDEAAAEMLDEQSGESRSGIRPPTGRGILNPETGWNQNSMVDNTVRGFVDSGGASRFFYCAKASTRERNAGLEGRNNHPTVKPIALAKWLASLLLPPESVKPRRLLVPFSGSGSEVIGAMQAGWDEIVCVERETEYADIAKARIAAARYDIECRTALWESDPALAMAFCQDLTHSQTCHADKPGNY